MAEGKKVSAVHGLPVSPADYVIDFLRCTIEAEDPYVVAVVFFVLLKATVATCLRICRVKNKFVDRRLPTHIQTNILLNLLRVAVAQGRCVDTGAATFFVFVFQGLEPCTAART